MDGNRSDSGRFEAHDDEDVIRLVAENPLVWIFLTDVDGPFAAAAPVRPGIENKTLKRLVGHVPRNARIARSLEQSCRALVLVLGPHGYISPSWMRDRTQAPTWNYTSVQLVTEIRTVDDPDFLHRHLRDLTGALERGRANPWSIDEMGGRLEQLSARIVAFEADIVESSNRFKLGQDENDETWREIIQALENEDKTGLLAWMRTFNSGRASP